MACEGPRTSQFGVRVAEPCLPRNRLAQQNVKICGSFCRRIVSGAAPICCAAASTGNLPLDPPDCPLWHPLAAAVRRPRHGIISAPIRGGGRAPARPQVTTPPDAAKGPKRSYFTGKADSGINPDCGPGSPGTRAAFGPGSRPAGAACGWVAPSSTASGRRTAARSPGRRGACTCFDTSSITTPAAKSAGNRCPIRSHIGAERSQKRRSEGGV